MTTRNTAPRARVMVIDYQEAIAEGLRSRRRTIAGFGPDGGVVPDIRDGLVQRYSWAIPNAAAIRALVELGPIVEIGAGTGYWAHLVRQAGGDIVAYDAHPVGARGSENRYHGRQKPWFPVRRGGVEVLARHRRRTLFLCWPPGTPGETLAYQAVRAYAGSRVVYIGEEPGGVTGTPGFFVQMKAHFSVARRLVLPRWPYCRDSMTIWERKA